MVYSYNNIIISFIIIIQSNKAKFCTVEYMTVAKVIIIISKFYDYGTSDTQVNGVNSNLH